MYYQRHMSIRLVYTGILVVLYLKHCCKYLFSIETGIFGFSKLYNYGYHNKMRCADRIYEPVSFRHCRLHTVYTDLLYSSVSSQCTRVFVAKYSPITYHNCKQIIVLVWHCPNFTIATDHWRINKVIKMRKTKTNLLWCWVYKRDRCI